MAKLTQHAKLKIKERNIKLSEALSVIERPSMAFYNTITGCNIALASWKSKPDNNFLYLMFFDEQEIKIITLSKPEELTRKRESHQVDG